LFEISLQNSFATISSYIIGTKIATKVLHDEDLVEVDADKGVVSKLNK